MAIFSFPNPVNETSARIVAAGVAGMGLVAVLADQPWLLAPLTYGFAARVVSGPTLSPLAQIATRVITPRLAVHHRYSPGPPKRLAQGIGLACSGAASVLAATGHRRSAYRLLSVLIGAAGLEAVFGLCLGCKIFSLAMKAGVIPESTCEACQDIWSRYPGGRPAAWVGQDHGQP